MAAEIVGQVINVVVMLFNPITGEFGYLFCAKGHINDLKDAMSGLKIQEGEVKGKVEAAKQQHLTIKQQVELWLKDVEDTERKVQAIEEPFNDRKTWKCLGECHPNCWSTYRLGRKAAILERKVKDLVTQGSFETVDDSLPARVMKMPTTFVVGIDEAMQMFRRFAREEEVGIICISGMGGIGKTTLLKKINNEYLTEENHKEFEVVIWVTIPKGPLNVSKIQKDIGDRLRLSLEEGEGSRIATIFNFLRTKKFMLLIDDLWERLDLENVGIPHPDRRNKCKIVFTARSMDVCGIMGAERRMKLEVLKEKEAWELFEKNVGSNVDINSTSIQLQAKAIVKKCGGLPLALVTIGRLMSNKKTLSEWKDVRRALKNSPDELREVEEALFSLLRVSYDSLPDNRTRSCFLYCSLFPEDHSILIGQLIDCYIGEGFFDELNDADEARDKGHHIVASLKAACLLENGDDDEERKVKMHDVMRDLAFWIASKNNIKYLVHAGPAAEGAHGAENMSETIPKIEKWKDAQRILIMDTGVEALTEEPNCPNLMTLILHNNQSLSHISHSFFDLMPLLKVLDLSLTSIEELPAGIGKLLELQYLNVMHTNIKSLPIELASLVKLRYLNLSYTNLKANPCEVLMSFPKLQVLNLYHCTWEDSSISLEEFKHLISLSTLGINIKNVKDLENIYKSRKLSKCIRYLHVSDCQGLLSFGLPSLLRNNPGLHLRALAIRTCKTLEQMVIDAQTDEEIASISNLEELILEALPNFKIIWNDRVHPRCLQNLHTLHIEGCHKLRNITWVVHLENLSELYLSSCRGIKELIVGGDQAIEEELHPFSKLREMELRGLPKLETICRHPLPFPHLKCLYVLDCPKLKKLPLNTRDIRKTLQAIHGTQEWWDHLEWEDTYVKSNFATYFRKWN